MRGRIVEAARRLFTERGFQATSLRDVVREAETSIGNCYFYFQNKEALLEAVIERACADVGEVVDRAMAEWPPGPTRLAAAVYTGVSQALADPGLARLVFVEDPHAHSRSQAFAHFVNRTRRSFEDAPALVSHAWQATVFQVIEAVTTGAVQISPHEAARFCAAWNLRGLGLPAPAVETALAGLDAHLATQTEGEDR
jgi:AcrR family transcriptional regulator